jgi:hypothetical protein
VTGSNRRPPACKAGALPAELTALSANLSRFRRLRIRVRGVYKAFCKVASEAGGNRWRGTAVSELIECELCIGALMAAPGCKEVTFATGTKLAPHADRPGAPSQAAATAATAAPRPVGRSSSARPIDVFGKSCGVDADDCVLTSWMTERVGERVH